ncbi:MAG: hypothetical protein R2941_00005, partial [Desulfobacterales bacterium]
FFEENRELIMGRYMATVNKIKAILCLILVLGIPGCLWGASWPPQPFIIAGTLKINGIRGSHDDGSTYIVIATDEDLMPFSPAAEDRDGLREEYDSYHISIPIWQETSQPDGAVPGETAILHVYKNGSKLLVTSPSGGRITVGNSGEMLEVNLEAMTGPSSGTCYSEEEVNAAVKDAVKKWDVGEDGIIGLPEAIRALQTVSGIRTAPSD